MLTIVPPRKKLQQNKQQSQNSSKPKVKRHRTDLDRLYVEYQVVFKQNLSKIIKKKMAGEGCQEGEGGEGGGAGGEVGQGSSPHQRGGNIFEYSWQIISKTFIENLSLKNRKGERDQVLLTLFVDGLSL